MPALDWITIHGFKSLRSVEKLPLRSINVIIGANGSGKSNFISAFSFLHAIREGRLEETVKRAGGADEVLFYGRGETDKIKLGISCENLDGKGYFLFPRSSISKTPLRMANSIGLIDGGYRGEIMAACDNIKDYDFSISKGDRLFQLVSADLSEIEFKITDNLSDSSRGKGGFGSTGA